MYAKVFILLTLSVLACNALSLYTNVAVHLATGVGSTDPGSPYGTPTLSLSAVQVGSDAQGLFLITYPADSDYPDNDTDVFGNVTCFSLSDDGLTAYVTGFVETSSGDRSSNFPVGSYVAIAVSEAALNFSPGSNSGPCAPQQTANLALTRGEFLVE